MLEKDRDDRLKTSEADKAWLADNAEGLAGEEDQHAEAQLQELGEEQQPEDDDHKTLMMNQYRLNFQAALLNNEDWQARLAEVREIKVFKMGKFMQAIFYLLGYEKEKVVEEGTQRFNWKKAKTLLDASFLEKMQSYTVMGEKRDDFKPYQTINYVERLIEGVLPEQVDEFNMTAGRLFKWLLLAAESRKTDIIRRRALLQRERDERDAKIQAKEKRDQEREGQLEAAKQAFLEEKKDEIREYEEYVRAQESGENEYAEEEDEDEEGAKEKKIPEMPVFDEEAFLASWDAENPEIIISEETADHVDNDWILTQEEIDEKVKQYWGGEEGQ